MDQVPLLVAFMLSGCGTTTPPTGTDLLDPATIGDTTTTTTAPMTSTTTSTTMTTTTTIAPDSDGDGLSDVDEVIWATDPADPDTDNDLLSDGSEVNVWGSNPLVRDTDGDLLGDGVEVFFAGSLPTLADTDSDGLDDYDEWWWHATDPTNPDTDGDGLLDGDEVNIHSTSPHRPDTDEDGLTDGEEVNVYGTDPQWSDSDGDLLGDGDELLIHGTDPNLADTDAGGTNDSEEVNRFGTDPLNGLDDIVCVDMTVDAYDAGSVLMGDTMDLHSVSVEWNFSMYEMSPRDYARDVDGDGTPENFTADVTFSLFDSSGGPLCTVEYDASGLDVVGANWNTSSGGALVGAWSMRYLRDAITDCGPVDAAIFGSTDIRDVIEAKQWGLAIGELVDLATPLEAEVLDAGGDWSADWAPYVMGAYLTFNERDAIEIGHAFLDSAPCNVLELNGLDPVRMPVPSSLSDVFLESTSAIPLDAFWALAPPHAGVDTCLEADLLTPMTTGNHSIEGGLSTFFNTTDIMITDVLCGGLQTSGTDGMYPFTLAPGESLSVSYTNQYNGSVYVLDSCGDDTSCRVGADSTFAFAGVESLVYANTSGIQEDLFLVFDCSNNACGHYIADVSIQP